LSKTCFQNAQKCIFFRCNFANFPGGMPSDLPRMAVPLSLPLKLICDVTRLWRNLAPLGNFFVRHWLQHLFSSFKFLVVIPEKNWKQAPSFLICLVYLNPLTASFQQFKHTNLSFHNFWWHVRSIYPTLWRRFKLILCTTQYIWIKC